MHTYLAIRGVKKEHDDFINQLQGKFLPHEIKHDWGKSGDAGYIKKGNYQQQVSVRPITLWEIVYPEQHQELMHRTIFGKSKGNAQYGWQDKILKWFRKIIKLEPIPDFPEEGDFLPIGKQHLEIVGLGIKKDRYNEHGDEML